MALNAKQEGLIAELIAYAAVHGHMNVPRTYQENKELVRFVRNAREYRRRGTLCPELESRLVEVGFVFDPLEKAWEEQFEALLAFIREHGHAKVPRGTSPFAIWVMHQRAHAKEGILTEERHLKLAAAGFIFETQDEVWEENLKKVRAFTAQFGHAAIPLRFAPDPQLAIFASEMRRRYKNGTLSSEQVADLNRLQFCWTPKETAWELMLDQYRKWAAISGADIMPPKRIRGENNPLYDWAREQLKAFKAGKLKPEREALLRDAGYPFPSVCFKDTRKLVSREAAAAPA